MAEMIVHGGDVWQVADDLGIEPSELLDFSANINPRGLPPRARERLIRDASDPRLLSAYPDPSARRLRAALSRKLDVPAESIVVGPGAEALLAPVLRAARVTKLAVCVPAFSEYRRVCEQLGIEFVPISQSSGATLLNNPHNPTGELVNPDDVRRMRPLVIDEAFIDYAPHASMVREAAEHSSLIVIRSLTKFYGCPALRVGYAVAHPDTACHIQSLLPTWPVTQLALDALTEAVTDREYEKASLRDNAIERDWLTRELNRLGLRVFPSAANYLFMELSGDMPASSELRSLLIVKHRILIRNCDSYEGLATGRYIRVAVRFREENCRLIQALTEELK